MTNIFENYPKIKTEAVGQTVPVARNDMLSAREYLQVALGGNMNFGTLKPLAIEEIMDAYADHKIRHTLSR